MFVPTSYQCYPLNTSSLLFFSVSTIYVSGGFVSDCKYLQELAEPMNQLYDVLGRGAYTATANSELDENLFTSSVLAGTLRQSTLKFLLKQSIPISSACVWFFFIFDLSFVDILIDFDLK